MTDELVSSMLDLNANIEQPEIIAKAPEKISPGLDLEAKTKDTADQKILTDDEMKYDVSKVIKIQSIFRRNQSKHLVRQRCNDVLLNRIILIQSHIRRLLAKKQLEILHRPIREAKILKGIILIQANTRRLKALKQARALRESNIPYQNRLLIKDLRCTK